MVCSIMFLVRDGREWQLALIANAVLRMYGPVGK